jgi:Integrase core domain
MVNKDTSSDVGRLYVSPRLSGALSGLIRFMKERGLENREAVKRELSKIPEYTKFRSIRKKFKRIPVRINFVNYTWIMDLIETDNYYSKSFRGKRFRYCLLVLDGFSKKAWMEKLVDKKTHSVILGLDKILKRSRISPVYLQSDSGGEFLSREALAFYRKNNIQHYTTFSALKVKFGIFLA